MRLARLVVAGLALGAAIGFVGALVRPRSVHNAILAATVGTVGDGAAGADHPAGAGTGPGGTGSGTEPGTSTSGAPSSTTRSLGVPALTGSGGAC
jgi:hypothetical protein